MVDIAGNTSTTSIISATGAYFGALEADGDSDWWRVILNPGLTYSFTVFAPAAPNAIEAADLWLHDSQGARIQPSWENIALTFTPGTRAIYYIEVADHAPANGLAEGNYAIRAIVSDRVRNDTATTAVIAGSGVTAGALEANTDSDWYRLSLTAGRSYGWEVTELSGLWTSRVELVLRDAQGQVVSLGSPDGILRHNAATSGTYYLEARDAADGDGTEEGGFTLVSNMSDSVAANIATSATILNGMELRGRIDLAQDQDWYRLNAVRGVTYEMRLNGYGADALDFNQLRLLDPNGRPFMSDIGTFGEDAVLRFRAPVTGPVYLAVGQGPADDVGPGDFLLSLRSDARWITGTNLNETLSGMDNDNIINGAAGSDVLKGNGGNDRLIGGWGNDALYGGAGHDIALYSGNVAITASLALSGWQYTGQGYDRLNGIEGLIGGSVNDVLTGNGAGNSLDGGTGNDRLDGGGGNDTLIGGLGNDTITGGTGADTLAFAPGGGRAVNLSTTAAQGTGEGTDRIIAIEHVIGTNFNDRFTGSAASNRLEGFGGADQLRGLGGNDQLLGGTGNDLVDGGDGHDGLSGGSGNDTLLGAAGNDTLLAGSGNDLINGGSGIDLLIFDTPASSYADLLRNTPYATGQGYDRILGIESIRGGNGHDRFFGNNIPNVLEGGNGHDLLDGRAGNDRLIGGAGRDTLRGGLGNDILTGGDDADVFLFLYGEGFDRITDFRNGLDHVDIRSGANRFADLHIAQFGADTHVSFGANKLVLEGVGMGLIDASDFIFS